MLWIQAGFTYNVCGSFTKKIIIKKETGDLIYIYQNELDKACFPACFLTYRDFKDLNRRMAADKVLPDKAFGIARNPKYSRYQCELAKMVYKCFDKETSGSGIKNENVAHKELTEELHKPIIREIDKRKLYSAFIGNVWGEDLADMQFISNLITTLDFYCVLLIFIANMHALFVWKVKEGITITNIFQKVLGESNCTPNKTWVGVGSEFYNRSMKSWLEKNVVETYSVHNEGKSVVAKRFIRALKNKIYKCIALIPKHVNIDN